LAIFSGAQLQELVVQPVPDPRLAVAEVGLALRDLVDVVQLAVIHPAGVDVEVRTEQGHAHHRAFQVPAGRTPAPRGVPAHHPALARLFGPPQREVGLAAAALDVLDPGRFQLPLGVHLGQRPVTGVLGGVEVQAGRQPVGEALSFQLGRELDHLRHVGAGPGVLIGGQDVQRGGVDEEDIGVERGDVQHRTVLAGRGHLELVLAGVGVGDRVPHVGDVDDVPHRDLLPAQARRSVSANTYGRMLPRCGNAYTVGPQLYMPVTSPDGVKSCTRRPSELYSRS
jgi:hypothetical protein